MNHTDAAAAYRTATFENAPPIKILHLLYEGAIRFLERARGLGPEHEEFRKYVHRADEIVSELRASLSHEPSPEFSANLESLYVFIQDELGSTLVEGREDGIENSIRILETLLDGWKQAQVQLGAEAGHGIA